jgi:hypothetical protein
MRLLISLGTLLVLLLSGLALILGSALGPRLPRPRIQKTTTHAARRLAHAHA